MDSSNLILTGAVAPPTPLGQMTKPGGVLDARKEQFAKDFESVFIGKLLDEMKNTIGEWGEEKDGPGKQIDSMFWSNLAKDMADKGGFGMWKDIYKAVTELEEQNKVTELLNEKL